MTNDKDKQQLISIENHLVLTLVNFELKKLADATTGCHNHLISKTIIRLDKNELLTNERVAEILRGYDDFLFKLLDDCFKKKHMVLLEEVMDNIFKVVGEFNQKQITATFAAAKAERTTV
ncbi:hypothetical protein [Pseudoalteromonas denitrificans]|nr:hypothetical protein [Pseudoalteromonas denitrificans]